MKTEDVQNWFVAHVVANDDNIIKPEWALAPEIAGTALFDAPLVCVASADDPLFQRIHDEDKVLGPAFRLPGDWLKGARSVISIFYPFSAPVRQSNWGNLEVPSNEWLHGRIEGQEFIHATDRLFADILQGQGFETCIPTLEPTFTVNKRAPEDAVGHPMFTSSWSERHVAWVTGLGTFGLCAHLITARGKAGRLGSIITTAELEPTRRPYGEDPFAYCTMCGACTKRCPVDALSLETGKNYQACWEYMEETKARFKPRYGCGKCQLQVPCETGIPAPRYRALSL